MPDSSDSSGPTSTPKHGDSHGLLSQELLSQELALMSDAEVLVIARINQPCSPADREECYEDPIAERLEDLSAGSLAGGGTRLAESGEILYCEVELLLRRASPEILSMLAETFRELGAPRGSKLLVAGREKITFGTMEGLALYLDGENLPAAIYEKNTYNDLYGECKERLSGLGEIRGYWNGPSELALYMYGESFLQMKAALNITLNEHPLCTGCRVVQNA